VVIVHNVAADAADAADAAVLLSAADAAADAAADVVPMLLL